MCLQKQGPFIFKRLHPSGCSVPCSRPGSGQLGSNLTGGHHYGSSAWGLSPNLPSDGWRVLPADLQVYPPIWRAGGRLANTLFHGMFLWCLSMVWPIPLGSPGPLFRKGTYDMSYHQILWSLELLKPRGRMLPWSYPSGIWQVPRQHCCRGTCQIPEWSDKYKPISRCFEI